MSTSTTEGQNHTFSDHLDSSRGKAPGPTPELIRGEAVGKARSEVGSGGKSRMKTTSREEVAGNKICPKAFFS